MGIINITSDRKNVTLLVVLDKINIKKLQQNVLSYL